eukprot:83199_1
MPGKGKRNKFLDNIHVQKWIQTCIQSQMDALASLAWLGSNVLVEYFTKMAFDHYTSPLVLLLVTISFIWLLLRYARCEHPGSVPIRIGHNILLGALSSGGKNGAMKLVLDAVMDAMDLIAADFIEYNLGTHANTNQEHKDNDDEETDEATKQRRTRKAKADAMRKKVANNMNISEWGIDWEHEKVIFGADNMGDRRRILIDGTTVDELLKQNAKLEGMSMWMEPEYWKAQEKMNGDENTTLILLNDKTVKSSTAGTVSQRPTVKKNQAVALLAGQLSSALELHMNKALDGSLSRTTISVSERTKSDGLKRIANIVNTEYVSVLTYFFYEIIRFCISCFDEEEQQRLKERWTGIIFSFKSSLATEQGVNHWKVNKHLVNIKLSGDIIEDQKLEEIDINNAGAQVIKSEKAEGLDHWYCWHNLETGGDMKLCPKDILSILSILSIAKDETAPHLNNRICRRFVDHTAALNILYSLEKAIEDNNKPKLNDDYLFLSTRAAKSASYFLLLDRELNGNLYNAIEVVLDLGKRFKPDIATALFLKKIGNTEPDQIVSEVGVVGICSDDIAIEKVIVFGDLDTTSTINKFVKNSITGGCAGKIKSCCLDLEGVLVDFTVKKGRGINCFVAHEFERIKLQDLDDENALAASLKKLKELIEAPKHPAQKQLDISVKRYCDLSGDSIDWIESKI